MNCSWSKNKKQANDVTYNVTDLTKKQRKLQREVNRMRDNIVRLEQNTLTKQETVVHAPKLWAEEFPR